MSTPIDSFNEKPLAPGKNLKSGLFELLFRPSSETLISKTGNYLLLAVAYLGGVFHWAWLINYGEIHYKYMDWQKFYNYYLVIQKALAEKFIPYFIPFHYKGTNQFLAIPEIDLSPTILLLNFLSVEEFILAQLLILYSLGFIGCLWFKRTYQWSPFTFIFFFLLFNFNGHIVSHIAIGHWPWISYFLFPFFVQWVFRLVEGEESLRHGTRLVWVLFGMLLLGGLHTFVWCLIFLILLCLCQKRFWKPVVIGVGLSLVLSLYRVLPAAITYFGYKNNFLSGFPTISVFWKALTSVEGEGNVVTLGFEQDAALWWEMDHFIGIIGLVVLIYFGIILRLKKKNTWGVNDYRVLNVPLLVLAILSFGKMFEIFTLLPIPFISVERVSSRFFIIPLLVLLVISCVWMQQMFNRLSAHWSVMCIALSGILIEGYLFIKHSEGWHVNVWEAKFEALGIEMLYPLSSWAKSVEWLYVPAVRISYSISLFSLIVFFGGLLYFKMRRQHFENVYSRLQKKINGMLSPSIDSLIEKLDVSCQNLKNGLFELLFRLNPQNLVFKAVNYLILTIVYLGGVFHWAWLINFGKVQHRYIDWQKFYEFYGVIQKSLEENSIPLFMPSFYKGTNQFLAIPETDLSPTLFLLKFLSVEDFFLTQLIIVYSVGFLGCLWLKRKYQWSLVSFVAFFLLFNFNGHITSHLAVGHWSWIAYFLFPFFVGWVLSLVEGDELGSRPARLAFVLFGILLLGGLHPFVWCLIFLLLLCLFRKGYWKPVLIGVGLALVFSTYRILPAAITFWGYKNPFMYGFPSASVFWNALTSIYQSPEVVLDMKYSEKLSMPWWEVDHYISILGLGFLMYFGFWRRWRDTEAVKDYRVLNIPMLIITVLSFGAIFGFIAHLPLPLISVERTPSRFLILPLLILLALSCIWMQKLFDRSRPGWGVQILTVGVITYQGIFLMEHSSVWYAHASKVKLASGFLKGIEPTSGWAKSVEEYYVPVVQVSYSISLIALVAFFAGTMYLKRKSRETEV